MRKWFLAGVYGCGMLRPVMERQRRLLWIGGILVFATLLLDFLGVKAAAIWPSVSALFLVFFTRNVLAGLLGGAVIGAMLLSDGHYWRVPMQLVEIHLLPHFSSSWKTGAIIFTLLLGGFVHLLERGGVLQDLLVRLLGGESRRKVETGAGVFGLVCFFDGLANSLMVGRLFQPMAERAGVSKVRLAYIVDTTSAAVACLAFISTWIAYQLAMIREGFVLAGREAVDNPYSVFFASVPHNYYAWFALILMVFVIWKQWNFGPMKEAEAKVDPVSRPAGETSTVSGARGLWRAAIPVVSLLGIVFVGIYLDGTRGIGEPAWPWTFEKLALSFAEANVPAILIIGSGIGSLLAWLFLPRSSLKPNESAGGVFIEGMLHLFQPILILVMAWMLSSTLNALDAADYLGELLGGRLPVTLLPLGVFLIGSLVAFTTGTSWGTMGLLMPLAIPLVFALSGSDAQAASLLPMVVGAVFSGAVFGDHCSPISDTTIVSSIACGVDPIDHVRTQLPYAFLAAGAAAILGFLPVALLGGSGIIAALVGGVFVFLLVFLHRICRSRKKA